MAVQIGNVLHEAGPLQLVRQGQSNGCGGGTDVLEGGGSRKSQRLLELVDQLPGVQRIEKVNIARATVENLHG